MSTDGKDWPAKLSSWSWKFGIFANFPILLGLVTVPLLGRETLLIPSAS